MLVNPDNSTIAEPTITDVRTAAISIGRQIEVLTASTNHEIDTAFASLGHKRADALLVNNDPLFYSRRVHLATLAAYHRVPTIYAWRESVEVGGLVSYGSNLADLVRQVGVYSGRILKGEKPVKATKDLAPKHLPAEERELWSALVRTYRFEDRASLELLTQAMEARLRVRLCREQVAKEGQIFVDKKGIQRAHPLLQIERSAQASFISALRLLRLDLSGTETRS